MNRAFLTRVGALARKEIIHILRDARVIDQGGTFPSPLARPSRASLPPPRAPRAEMLRDPGPEVAA